MRLRQKLNKPEFLAKFAEVKGKKTYRKRSKDKYCLNCGRVTTDRYCAHCGQSAQVPSRLNIKNFGKGVVLSFGRLTPGFAHTAAGLLFHPWTVIRDYIHGRQIRYSPPATMIIQLLLYATVLYALLDAILNTNLSQLYESEMGFGYEGDIPILKMLNQSIVLQMLIVGIVVCFAVYIAFYRSGAKKYNFAEYLTAFVYMYGTILIYDILLKLLSAIPGMGFDFSVITILIAFIFSLIALKKAFPKNSWGKIIFLFTLACLLSVIIAIVLSLAVISVYRLFTN